MKKKMKNKIINKKKVREFGHVELFETSCCGLPSYVYAHKSLSLVKSLKDLFPDLVSDRLNIKEKNPMVDEDQTQDASENPEGAEEKPDEESSEDSSESEEKPDEESSEESEDSSKSEESEKAANFSPKDMTKMMASAISEGISKGMTAIQNNAGLIDKSPAEKQKELIKDASIGELAASVFEMDKHI